jgi:formylglycine-generating enzyme required for sulfatase activity
VFRGGSWSDVAANLRAASRVSFAPAYSFFTLGFRCARDTP